MGKTARQVVVAGCWRTIASAQIARSMAKAATLAPWNAPSANSEMAMTVAYTSPMTKKESLP